MTLPPFDGPRARQATATLNGELAGPPGSPDPPGAPGFPGAPGSPDAPSFPVAPPAPAEPASRLQPVVAEPEPLNLARRPFVNTRPVERVAAILWVLGVALLVGNLTLFMGYLSKSQDTRAKLAVRQRDIAAEQHAKTELQGRLGKLGLDQQNREVSFLNRKIDERTFSWSLLFDRMAEVLPDEVRLLQLTPTGMVQRDTGLRAAPSEFKPTQVVLTMHCEAKDDEALLRFVDNLFAHPAFSEPNLQSEERLDNGLLRFDLTVQYHPNPPGVLTGPAPQTRTTRATRSPRKPSSTPQSRPEARVPGAPAGAGAGAGAAEAAGGTAGNRAVTPAAPASPGAAAAAAAAGASPAGAGLVRVAPPPRWPGAGGTRAPAVPGVPGRPQAPAAAPTPGISEPPPPAASRLPGAPPGPGNPPTSGSPGRGGRR
jgi:Tfp pilus assembly protein PilN